MFFLIDVSVAHRLEFRSHTSLSRKGSCASCTFFLLPESSPRLGLPAWPQRGAGAEGRWAGSDRCHTCSLRPPRQSGQGVGVCHPWKGARRDSPAFCLHETSQRPHVCLKYLHLPLCSPCWQKINAFSHDINSLIEGEESVGENESRLFTKIRNEFHKWNTVIEKAFQKGESGVPPATWRAAWSGGGSLGGWGCGWYGYW